jgi:hypothetical protein
MLLLASCLRPNDEEVIGKVLDGEAIVINLATGSYYAMAGVGAVIWQGIDERCSLQEIAVRVSANYDVSVEQAGVDVLQLAERLMQEGIATLAADSPEPVAAAPPPLAHRAAYAAPELTAYSDMRNLLALDPPMPSIDGLAGGGAKSDLGGSNES